MLTNSQVLEMIHAAFGKNKYPGDDYLLGSTEGSEPLEEIHLRSEYRSAIVGIQHRGNDLWIST